MPTLRDDGGRQPRRYQVQYPRSRAGSARRRHHARRGAGKPDAGGDAGHAVGGRSSVDQRAAGEAQEDVLERAAAHQRWTAARAPRSCARGQRGLAVGGVEQHAGRAAPRPARRSPCSIVGELRRPRRRSRRARSAARPPRGWSAPRSARAASPRRRSGRRPSRPAGRTAARPRPCSGWSARASTPCCLSRYSRSHSTCRACGSRPVVGSSSSRSLGLVDQRAGDGEPPLHAAGQRLDLGVGPVGRAGRTRAARRPWRCSIARGTGRSSGRRRRGSRAR